MGALIVIGMLNDKLVVNIAMNAMIRVKRKL